MAEKLTYVSGNLFQITALSDFDQSPKSESANGVAKQVQTPDNVTKCASVEYLPQAPLFTFAMKNGYCPPIKTKLQF